KIVSTFGVKGELVLEHRLGKKIAPAKIKVVFMEKNRNELLPFFVESAKKKGEMELMLKLEGLDTKEKAGAWLKHEVWLKEEELSAHTQKNNPIGWVGFRVLDGKKDLGEVLEVIEQPHQILCRLEIKGREVLVPVNEQTLYRIDHAGKRLLLELPEGLLEVYLL
ncbi:MAG TPA: hypothetical protein VG890_16265, partial [Puia sp.]|nr:hypothetical protein [Puia sp.]